MSDLDDLEAYEDVPPPLDPDRPVQAANGRKSNRVIALRSYAGRQQRRLREVFLDESRRAKPSLPRLKFLERSDP